MEPMMLVALLGFQSLVFGTGLSAQQGTDIAERFEV
jgi:hypothetical protein